MDDMDSGYIDTYDEHADEHTGLHGFVSRR